MLLKMRFVLYVVARWEFFLPLEHYPIGRALSFEELYYPSAFKAFQSNGFQVVSVKLDEQGIVIEDLERILQEHSVAAIYTTPHHQYPTTVTMP
jgi:DNA-binding transcriptional MocR family regulator